MKIILILAFLTACVAAESVQDFAGFQQKFGKTYLNKAEAETREKIFYENLKKVNEHNALYKKGEVSFSMGINSYSDMTWEEFISTRAGLPAHDQEIISKYPSDDQFVQDLREKYKTKQLPSEFNWVDQGAVSSIKNQGQCGSCAAFGLAASLETCHWQKTNSLPDLSEQYLLDCAYDHYVADETGTWGAFGCDGAWPQAYIDYLMKSANGYMQTEDAYPYREETNGVVDCKPKEDGWEMGATLQSSFNQWYPKDEELMAQIIVEYGPVVTSFQANSNFQHYSSGVFESAACCNSESDASCVYTANHAVSIVGYGTENGQDYWLIKNSWGSWWGDQGFAKFKRGTGHCAMGRVHVTGVRC